MYLLSVETEFAAAHFLSDYWGKCEQLHGHNYRVRVWFRGATLDRTGMLADFALLKQALRGIITPLDHSNLNDNPVFDNNPSAERIAEYIFNLLRPALILLQVNPELLYAVDVHETSTNMARYEA
ncbi:MAG: 6-carboxytetrahydropterin synthase QueD [Spirochaetaceae bacterium]|jgi:6-pyruvoyltetrahydropterin/6-carboxytetrahydropterin synthase|nr:6-carboxytetrahydropterin synthase QueD [Spirochaetaceae bacterium]